jgi:pSer/pThr/pTyr-binding forkhead associated (FHA) protein
MRPIILTHELTFIGREPDNDIVLDDDRVSRRHAELRWERGRVELADYGSLNGTRINQQAARGRLPLRDGDLIEFGKRRYQLQTTQAARPDVTPAAHQAQQGEAPETPEAVETRKTARVSGATAEGKPLIRLTLIQGAAGGAATVWPLSAAVTTIGRDLTCGVPLADTSISRLHAEITRQPAGYFIADLQSSNGVTLNGQRLEGPAQIFAGDIIAVGDCLLRCEEAPAQPQAMQSQATPGIAAEPPASAAPTAQTLTGAPSFHMRIAPGWSARRDSRPRLAPPRLTPSPRQDTPYRQDGSTQAGS